MTGDASPSKVQTIPIDRIDVANPRARSRRVFQEMVESIAKVGLKRPITVARRPTPDGDRYDLVCGQGRLEAFRALGQAGIPAVIVDADGEDCLVMGLVENVARRQHQPRRPVRPPRHCAGSLISASCRAGTYSKKRSPGYSACWSASV